MFKKAKSPRFSTLCLETLESRWVLDASAQLLVTLAPNSAPNYQMNALAKGVQITHGFKLLPNVYEARIQGITETQALTSLKANKKVVQAIPNVRIQIEKTPNDPFFPNQYGLQNLGKDGGLAGQDISATKAWDKFTGKGSTLVAVIDTGIDYMHPDLASNIWTNPGEIPGNNKDDDGNGYVDDIHGYDFANHDSDPMDDNGHGTHVAGIIGAVGNNGLGTSGVNWNTKMMALKFLDADGTGYISDAIEALDYATRMGARISNNSWGSHAYFPILRTAIARARDQGHIFVAAAGNDGSDNDNGNHAGFPATFDLDNIVAVAAQNNRGELADFSNYGTTSVDIAAPGQDILSTFPGGRYATLSGTSMATPFVTGAISLVLDAYPTLKYKEAIDKVFNSADTLPSLDGLVAGARRLNVSAALGSYGTIPRDTLCPKIEKIGFSASGNSLTGAMVTFSESINTDSFTASDITFNGPMGNPLAIASVKAEPDSGGKVFRILLSSPATTLGNYRITIGSNIADLAGNLVDNNGNGKGGEPGDSIDSTYVNNPQTTFTNNTKKPIQDFQTTSSTIEVPQDLNIFDLNVRVNIDHPWISDLFISVQGPGGSQVTLFDQRGKGGKQLTGTVFDDEASSAIRDGSAPFSGNYLPESALSAFDGKNAKGTWTLSVTDRGLNDQGSLVSWSMDFAPQSSPGGVPSFVSRDKTELDYGSKLNFQFEAKSSGKVSYRAKDLPVGLELSPSGLLTGKPKSGTSTFKVFATTPTGQEAAQSFTLVINKATLDLKPIGVDKNYDGRNTATVRFQDNRVEGDNLEFAYSATFSDIKVGANKTINIANVQLKGSDAENYILGKFPSITTASIMGMAVNEGTLTLVASSQDDKIILALQDKTNILVVFTSGKKSTTYNSFPISDIKKILIYGLDGNDELTQNSEVRLDATMYGGNGDDILRGGDGNDTLFGESGNDSLYGGKGNDLLDGGLGNDSLSGQVGNDILIAGNGDNSANSLDGGDGSDVLQGSEGNDNLYGGDGSGDDGADTINGMGGDDYLFGGAGNDILDGGDGNDSINGASGDDLITGGNGNDNLIGETGSDILLGGAGDDSLDGGDGNDILVGGDGNDYLAGGSGLDFLIGGLGIDKIKGETGDDILIGGTTIYDTDTINLKVIQTEWTRIDLNVSQKKTNIGKGVGASSKIKLDLTTVIDDKAEDQFFTSSGDDWLWF